MKKLMILAATVGALVCAAPVASAESGLAGTFTGSGASEVYHSPAGGFIPAGQ